MIRSPFSHKDRYDNKRVHLGIRGTGSCRVTVKVASNPSGGRVHTKDDYDRHRPAEPGDSGGSGGPRFHFHLKLPGTWGVLSPPSEVWVEKVTAQVIH